VCRPSDALEARVYPANVLYCSVMFYVVGTLCEPCSIWVCGFNLYNVLLFYISPKHFTKLELAMLVHYVKGVA
jgi:hypothetical protein